jgi:hypothetical protein
MTAQSSMIRTFRSEEVPIITTTRRKGRDSRQYVHVEGDAAYVTLTQGKVAIIDASEAEKVGARLWFYDARGYALSNINLKPVPLHRFILNPEAGQDVDHISGDGLDNRHVNMRVCAHAENTRNQLVRTHYNGKPKSSKYKGVHFYKSRGKHMAYIMLNRKRRHLGYFKSETEAAKAYDTAARELFGKFASTNFPP